MSNHVGLNGLVSWELRGPDGDLRAAGEGSNIVTQVGDQMYGERGAGISSPPSAPTGMKLGAQTSPTTPAKTGVGAALESYLTGSQHAFDNTPTTAVSTGLRRITYKVTYAAGQATTASPITEAVIVNETLANSTSTAANTVARVLVTGIASKAAQETLTITWSHDVGS